MWMRRTVLGVSLVLGVIGLLSRAPGAAPAGPFEDRYRVTVPRAQVTTIMGMHHQSRLSPAGTTALFEVGYLSRLGPKGAALALLYRGNRGLVWPTAAYADSLWAASVGPSLQECTQEPCGMLATRKRAVPV